MLSQSMIETILDEAMMRGADFAELYDESTLMHEVTATQERCERCQSGRESGVGIRIFKNQKCFYGYSNEKTEGSMMELVRKLTSGMKKGAWELAGLGEKQLYPMGEEMIPASGLTLKQRLEPVHRAIHAGMTYDEEIVRMQVKRTDMDKRVQIANTEGIFLEEERVKTRLYMIAYAQNGTAIQSGYLGPGAMRGNEFYEQIDVEAYAREAARSAKVVAHAAPCKGGQMSVIVKNGFGGLLFHEACGHSLEALGIASSSSEFCGKLGRQVASDVVTLIDDGTVSNEWGSQQIDDEGVPTRKNVLIERGILKGYMVDRFNGMRMGMQPTGSARRQNYRFAPTARMTNTYIAPGKDTPEEIIQNTEKGLYVATINGGSVDPATGDFNFNAGECYLVEHGKITVPVRGVTLIGNGGNVLKRVDMVANDFALGQGFCYASSGALYVGCGQPTVRVSNMTVGGIG